MLSAWKSLFDRETHRLRTGRAPTPLLTSLENPDRYQYESAHKNTSRFSPPSSADSPSLAGSSINAHRYSSGEKSGSASTNTNFNMTELEDLARRPIYNRAGDGKWLPTPSGVRRSSNSPESASLVVASTTPSRSATPALSVLTDSQVHHLHPTSLSRRRSPRPPSRRFSQTQPESSADSNIPRSYIPMRDAPSPPYSPSRSSVIAPRHNIVQPHARARTASPTDFVLSRSAPGEGVQKSNSSKVRGRISAPIPSSFVHVGGTSRFADDFGRNAGAIGGGVQRSGSQRSGSSGLAMHPVEESDL